MRDFLRFVIRGSWASAMFALVLTIWFWGSLGVFFILSPSFLVRCVIPGAIVGVVLWIVTGRINQPLTWSLRVAIGALVSAVIFVAFILYTLHVSPFQFPQLNFGSWMASALISAAAFGSLAGSACPSQREHKPGESQPTYRERVRLYEAAEREAQAARQGIQSGNNKGFNHCIEG